MRYAVVIEKTDTGFSAYVPDLPGCVAIGGTLPATQANLRDAIALHLRGMQEDNEPIPSPTAIAEYIETDVA